MIKEKYKWFISIISLIITVILIFTLTCVNSSKDNENKKLIKVLNKDEVTEISIDIDKSDWEWLLENSLKEEYKKCNITINGITYNNVGIRPKGNTSLTNVANDNTTDRYSFKIDFDQYVDGQNYNGMESIVLNNMIQDNTYMKEYITYDLYDFLGVAVPEMSYSNVSVNGEEWGLYLAIEVVDERYLENNFGTTEGNLYKPETMGVNNNGEGGGNPPQGQGGKGPQGGPPNNENQDGQQREFQEGNPPMQDNEQRPPENNDELKNNNIGNPPDMNNDNREQQADNNKLPENEENRKNDMGGKGGRATEGADFKYIDDNVSSYSIVRDSAVFKRTTDEDFKKVINMYKNLNDGTNLEDVLDVEEILKYFAVNTYLVNLDSYSGAMYHNYYLYEKDGKCQILPWDLNLSFGGFGVKGGQNNESSSSTNAVINFPIDNPVSGNLEDMPLLNKLLENNEYKELYHSYLKKIADEYFNNGYYADLVNKIDSMISSYVEKDTTKFCTYEEYEKSIPQMITFGEDRTKSVLAQLNGEQPSIEYGTVESNIEISALGNMGGGKQNNNKIQQFQDKQDQENINTNEQKKQKSEKKERDSNKQNNIDKKQEIIIIIALIFIAVLADIFVMKYKRRKY